MKVSMPMVSLLMFKLSLLEVAVHISTLMELFNQRCTRVKKSKVILVHILNYVRLLTLPTIDPMAFLHLTI